MNLNGAEYFAELLSRSDVFMLIFVRMIGFMAVVPLFGVKNIPVMKRRRLRFCCRLWYLHREMSLR
jgi:flagellar biosynthesis protein FliR